jgi:hypothetical protein
MAKARRSLASAQEALQDDDSDETCIGSHGTSDQFDE